MHRTLFTGIPRRLLVLLSLAALLAGLPAEATAGNRYRDEDISLRLASAFIRFTEVSAFGGEAVANRWSSAVNPAAAGWEPISSDAGILLAPYWCHIRFAEGTNLNIFGEAASWDTRSIGTFQPTLSQVRSNEEEDKSGLEFDYETDVLQLQWGYRLGDAGVGVTLNYAETEVVQSFGGMAVRQSEAETWRVRLGGLYELCEDWLLGGAVEYGWSPFDYEAVVFTQFGPMTIEGDDTQRQFVLRGGLSYEYEEFSTVYLDYQFGRFVNDTGTLRTHRFSAGVQHRVLPFLFLRAGSTVDHRMNVGFLAGAHMAFSEWGTFDLGYQVHVLPELSPDFGRSNTFQLTLTVRF